jgi:hypothetical protein
MRKSIGACVALAVLVLAGGRVAAAGQNNAAPDLTGTWVLSHELSDKPGQGGEGGDDRGGGRRGGGGRPGGMGGGMGGRGGGYGGGGGMPSPEEMERMSAAMDAARRAPERLIIVKADPGLVVTDEDGVSMRLALDGRKETGAVNGVPFESTTKWDGGKLRVERKFKSGLKLIQLYDVSVEPRLLTITSKIEGGRGGGRSINRVYEPQ